MKKLSKILLSLLMVFTVITGNCKTAEASTIFTPRLTAPSSTDPHWINVNYGGYNRCITINGTSSCLPNCTGYVWGRAYEILGYAPSLSINNAYQFWEQNLANGYYSYGQTPKLGAVICWGRAWDPWANEYTLGHVAIVEKIEGDYITYSQSNYGGTRWELVTKTLSELKAANLGNFQGFIYLGDFSTGPGKPTVSVSAGSSISNTTFSWAATDNTDHYDLRVYYSDGTLYKDFYNIKETSYSLVLPAGSFYANVASVASNGNYVFSDNVSFTVSLKAAIPELKISSGTESVPTVIYWDEAENAVDYSLEIFVLCDDGIYRCKVMTSRFSETSYEIQLDPGLYEVRITSYTSGSRMSEGEFVPFTVIETPSVSDDGWYYSDVLPSNITTDDYEIQYSHYSEVTAETAPDSSWVNKGLVKSVYENDGGEYTSLTELGVSNYRVLVDSYYFHYCSGSMGNSADYYQSSSYIHYDEISDVNSVYVSQTGPDGSNPDIPYYHLKWNDGSWAYCSSGTTCDGSAGAHGNRTYVWYKCNTYQNKKLVNYYQFVKETGWVTTIDTSADEVTYRYRPKTVAITSVSLNKTSLSLEIGNTATLTATINPSNTTADTTLTWTSSNTNVATVSNGKVTAKNAGTATITVKTSNGKTATCTVTVTETEKDVPITSVSLNKTSLSLETGNTATLTATINPSNTTGSKTLTWTSSNTNVATVSNGKVTAKNVGTATITVKTSNGKTATCTVTVKYPNPFDDVAEGKWYTEPILRAAALGIMTGKTDTHFGTTDPLSRAAMATVLYRLAGEPSVEGEQPSNEVFPDVSNTWYTKAITWAYTSEIVTGHGNGTFKPNDGVTRQQLALMLQRYAKEILGEDVSVGTIDFSQFSDGNEVASWAREAMQWAIDNGIISGNDNGTLKPKGTVSRAQCAVMLMRFYDQFID